MTRNRLIKRIDRLELHAAEDGSSGRPSACCPAGHRSTLWLVLWLVPVRRLLSSKVLDGHRDAGHAIRCCLIASHATLPSLSIPFRHHNPAEHLLSNLLKHGSPGLTSALPSNPPIRDTSALRPAHHGARQLLPQQDREHEA